MDGVRSIARIADVLDLLAPDVICLQEVHRYLLFGAFQNQPAMLAKSLGMYVHFSPAMHYLPAFGNVVLSRWQIREVATYALPNAVERRRYVAERRVAQAASIAAPSGLFTAMNTHWSLRCRDRERSAEVIANLLPQLSDPVVLAGDLNAGPDAPEIERLRAAGLADAMPGSSAGTFPADAPKHRIDYVWVRGCGVGSAEVIDTDVSDHRPLLVTLSLETAGAPTPSTDS